MAGRKTRQKISMVSRKRAPVGAPPGTLIADPAGTSPALRLITYDGNTITDNPGATIDMIAAEMSENKIIWADVAGVGDAEFIARIGEIFEIDRLALEDVLNVHQRPKVETYGEAVYIVAHMYDGVSAASREQFSMFLSGRFVVTFQERPGDCLEPVRKRLNAGLGRIRTAGADYLAYAILDCMFDAYFPMTEKLGDALEELEEAIIAGPHPKELATLHEIRRELLTVKRSLWPAREALTILMHGDTGHVSQRTSRFMRDVHDHIMQLVDLVETYREMASGLLELYASSVSNRMNEVMKVLTIIATIFIPLSFLAGIWGMNFDRSSPWNMPELGWAFGYPLALGLMALVAFALLGWFRWKRWL